MKTMQEQDQKIPPVQEHSPRRRRFIYSETERDFLESLLIVRNSFYSEKLFWS